jgi:hypothetical protein
MLVVGALEGEVVGLTLGALEGEVVGFTLGLAVGDMQLPATQAIPSWHW